MGDAVKDRAIELVHGRPQGADGRNVLREYLQSRILGAMQEAGAMVPLAFMGGTALRSVAPAILGQRFLEAVGKA